MKNIPYEVTEARTRLLSKAVFFGVILYEQCKLVILEEEDTQPGKRWAGVDTACTDGRNICIYMPFFRTLNLDERVFVMAHEIYHVMAMHTRRMKYYQTNGLHGYTLNPSLLNVAMDAIVNPCLISDGIGTMPKDCVHFPNGVTDKNGVIHAIDHLKTTPEDVYGWLMRPEDPDADGGGGSGSDGDGDADPTGGRSAQQSLEEASGRGKVDEDLKEADSQTDSQINEAEMKATVQSAAMQAKAQGQLPAGIKRFVDDFLDPQILWEEKLRTCIVAKSTRETTSWARPNRRKLVAPGIIMPRKTGFSLGHIVVAVDTSGSVSEYELKLFLSEMVNILGDLRPEKMTVIWCDAVVERVDELTQPEELIDLVRTEGGMGGGGTSFVPPFEYVRDEMAHEDVGFFIYATDMYAPFPDKSLADGFPVIWLATSNVEGPFGETIQLDMNGRY